MLGIYTRLSKIDDNSNSIENQLIQGEKFAKANSLQFKIYNEGAGLSGGLGEEDRPQLKNLLNGIRESKVTAVWIRDQKRIERDTKLYLEIIKLFTSKGVDFYINDVEINYKDSSNIFHGTIFSAFSEYQRNHQGELAKGSIKANYELGKSHGLTPYGYTTDKDRYIIIDKDEAEVVKRIYKLSLEGLGTPKIAEKLNEDNVPTRYNKMSGTLTVNGKTVKKSDIKWVGNTVRTIIINTFYKGARKTGGSKKNPTIIYYKSPAIFEESYWQKVNDNLKLNINNGGKKVDHKYLLKGIMKCSKCGRNYYGRINKKVLDYYYMCSSKRIKTENCGNRSINIGFIEELIWNTISKGDLKSHIKEYIKHSTDSNKIEEIDAQLIELDKQSKNAKNQLSKLIDFALNGVFTNEEIVGKKKVLIDTQNDIKIKIENLKETRANLESDLYTKELDKDIKEDRVYSFTEKREIIQRYIYAVNVLYRDDVNHVFNGGEYFIKIQFQNADIKPMIYVARRNVKDYVNLPIWGSEGASVYPYKAYNEETGMKELLEKLKAEKS